MKLLKQHFERDGTGFVTLIAEEAEVSDRSAGKMMIDAFAGHVACLQPNCNG